MTPTGQHLTELCLEQLQLGELHEHSLKPIEQAHLHSCEQCRSRRDQLASGFDAHTELDSRALFNRIQRQVSVTANTSPPRRQWTRASSWFGGSALMAAAAAVLLYATHEPANSVRQSDVVRLKGQGPSLTIHRLEADGSIELLSGSVARKGDRIRFVVSPAVPAGYEIMVAGTEASGERTIHYPQTGSSSAPVLLTDDGALDGAVELDDYVGTEHFQLVVCPRRFSLTELATAGQRALLVPEGCTSSAFELTKE